jgi:hypothetical protein
MLGVGAIMTGLYMLYRDKIKEHPVISTAIGAALGYALLKSSGGLASSPFVSNFDSTPNYSDNQPSLQKSYLLKSYV